MPNYAIPGVRTTRPMARGLGVLLVLCTVAAVLTWNAYQRRAPTDTLRIQLRTEQIGAGIGVGTAVRLDGVAVGRIAAVRPVERGRQLLTLELDRSQTAGLTDTFGVDYAPENLFGISTLALRAEPGGAPLRDGQLIDVGGRVEDVTMGALLRTLTGTVTEVLTPELTELLTRIDTDLRAFTPIIEAVVELGRIVADTQVYPSSFLIDQYGSFLNGFGAFTSATFRLAAALMDIEIFRTERERYDTSITVIRDGVLLGLADTLNTLRTHLGGLIGALTPTVEALAGTVPDPATSRAQLTELIERLDRVFADTPDGPVVSLEVTLRGVPAVGVPLLGQQAFTALTQPEGVR
ncbi:mammalian cell entry protein [Nocardia otitidiscaviarum]|uniref:Mammalian cell entry protein n=1 Tax=Nocardia otitidiscaviarum TaxID=1823 RepID=A0A516NN09_9NOCA|nr:mammalian cell entry protein [Nocardia otitidiscaviarum]MCP9625261.1 mammalian cell entry protein [Nocardia otitidiscaviarum]QDP80280.1 mammalian cell entry protein [Nocardia otitidiscaviarum]